MQHSIWVWVAFNAFILAMLAIDLGVFHRRAHAVSVREAAAWTSAWIALSLLFNLGLYHLYGAQPALEFLAGYLIEKALSVDNIFVFVLIFSFFSVPERYQHRVLFWGILGALVMRGGMIAAGTLLIQQFHWILYIFGAFLVFTGLRMSMHDQIAVRPEANPVLRLVRNLVPVTTEYRGKHFFVREREGEKIRRFATPLFIVLVVVETTDLVFAIDSIPAVFAITRDPFLIYTSNVFAILGLRSLYFLLAGIIHRFVYLKLGLSAVLMFVGMKMLIIDYYRVPIAFSLGFIATALGFSVIASLLFPPAAKAEPPADAVAEEPETGPPSTASTRS